jgi:hypothetical protein
MRKLTFTLLFVVLLMPMALSADVLPLGSWQIFQFGEATSQATPSYSLTIAAPALLRVVDCCVIGDQFQINIGGLFAFDTSSIVNGDGQASGASDGDESWAHPDLSKGSLLLGPGVYNIDEFVIRNVLGIGGCGDLCGSGFIRADLVAGEVPEPGTFGLLSLVLGGLGTMLVRRRS